MTNRTKDWSGISQGIDQLRGFYGWKIVGVSMFLLTLMSVTTFMGVGTYLVALESRFGWSRTAMSGAFSLARVQGAIIGPLEGFLVDRFGNRTMIVIGFVTMGVGFLLVARVTELWHFYATFFLVTVGSSLGGWLAIISMVNNWFIKHRSKAMATAMMGVHFGGFLVPVLALGIQSHGFSIAMTGIGAAMLLTVLPVFKSLSNRPEDRGERPDGPDFGTGRSTAGAEDVREVDFTPKQALKTRAFWILTVVHLSSTASIVSLSLHLQPKLVDMGMSLTGAATIVMWSTVFAIPSQMAAGFLADKLPTPRILTVLLLIQAVVAVDPGARGHGGACVPVCDPLRHCHRGKDPADDGNTGRLFRQAIVRDDHGALAAPEQHSDDRSPHTHGLRIRRARHLLPAVHSVRRAERRRRAARDNSQASEIAGSTACRQSRPHRQGSATIAALHSLNSRCYAGPRVFEEESP